MAPPLHNLATRIAIIGVSPPHVASRQRLILHKLTQVSLSSFRCARSSLRPSLSMGPLFVPLLVESPRRLELTSSSSSPDRHVRLPHPRKSHGSLSVDPSRHESSVP